MISLVTGVAGFVGSHLAERLLGEGHSVRGVDKFLDNYARRFKEWNLAQFSSHPKFSFVDKDLADLDLVELLRGVDYVFHQAGQPGVRSSWG
ncbi:MAG: GDP-mannose 4,6-dehydratase, partial [Candidatus Binatia bacterium]